MKIEIRRWDNNEIILCGEYESVADCINKNKDADLRYADLRSANLRYADLRYADLRSADLRYADLRSADLSSANLRSADLRSANLRYADLRSADLRYANLRYANLSSADLSYANLSSADLRYANLSYANLSSADLRSADLRYANLSYANLSSAKTIIDGKELEINKIICLLQERYSIIISDVHIEIGCQKHLPKNWWKFSDEEISKMDSGALEWWKVWKPIIKKIYTNGTKAGI